MTTDDTYLVWSNEHDAWWGPNANGYVRRVEHAGRYTHAQALQICFDAMPGRFGDESLQEIPIRLADVESMLQQFADRYPGRDPEP
jgi:hypothetical protein